MGASLKLKTYLLMVMTLFSSQSVLGMNGLQFTQDPVEDPLVWSLKRGNGYEWQLKDNHGTVLFLISLRQGLRDYLCVKVYGNGSDRWIEENSIASIAQLYADNLVTFPYTKAGYDLLLRLEKQEEEYESKLKSQFSLEKILAPLATPAPQEEAPASWEGELNELIKRRVSLEPEEEATQPQKKRRRALAVNS